MVGLAGAAAWTAGCGDPETSEKGASKGRLFGVSFQTMNNPFFVELAEGLRQVIEGHGDRLVILDAQFNGLKQRNDVADLLLEHPAAVFLNPVDWEGVRGTLIEARRRNVPVFIVDAPASDEDLVVAQIASDNVKAGQLACQALARVQPDAQVAILHLSVNKACIDRVAGFQEEMKNHPKMKLLDIQEGKGTAEAARPVMRDLLGRYPELTAAFPINDPSALGCISAIESAGRAGKVLLVSVDGSREAAEMIEAGKLLATSAQFPKEIGRIAAEKAYEHLAGKPVEKNIKVPVELITKENVDRIKR